MAAYHQDIVEICRKIQNLVSPDTQGPKCPLSIAWDITVLFPSRQETLKAVEHFASSMTPSKYMIIVQYYWEACQQIQSTIRKRYELFCHTAASVQCFVGPPDREVQRQVARGLSHRYAEIERRLSRAVTEKLLNQLETADSREKREKTESSAAKDFAKKMLEKAFAVNSMPTDADRDYLATQTGMSYKQVTVWFQNNRSRRINALPKRNRQQSGDQQHIISSHPSVTPPLQTGSSLTSLQEVEQHLRNPTDSPLAEHIELPDTSRSPQIPLPVSESGNSPKVESKDDDSSNNSNPANTTAETSRRPIAPLRKNRLAEKKSAKPTLSQAPRQEVQQPLSCQTTSLPAYLQSSQIYTDSPTQIAPAEILNQQDNQQRVPSNGSISEVDRLLGSDGMQTASSSLAVSSSSMENMLMLPMHALTGRSVSGSTAGEVDASLGNTRLARMGMDGMLDMVPMFNFLPPTPSNAGFMTPLNIDTSSFIEQPLSSSSGYPLGNANYPSTANFQFDPIDFSALFGFPSTSGLSSTTFPGPGIAGGAGVSTDADAAAQNLLKDLEELDFGEFLHSPETRRGSGFTDQVEAGQEVMNEPVPVEERDNEGVGKVSELEEGGKGTTVPYIFEEMGFAKFSDEKDIDPVIFELLKSIMADSTSTPTTAVATETVQQPHNTFLEHDTAGVSGTTQTLPTSISASTNSECPRESNDELPLNALAIDLSTLLHTHSHTHAQTSTNNTTSVSSADNSPRGSLYLQTTPSDVSDVIQFGTPFDELVYSPFAAAGGAAPAHGWEGARERQTVPQDVGRKRDSLQLLDQQRVAKLQQEDDAAQSWRGLLDFGDMFEAFWSMVDDSPRPEPQVDGHA
ncbi:hypothetical protein QFC24_001526 [Naganishia onofrii]|uniref:Uncharacterized protein n=1 Tax=Naganishia onofrii TaxID=1851511 RepID=A0ACC2XTU4_9TREE|nr:hypothetical protein QFC24_001526 [Naganishia onofrii]